MVMPNIGIEKLAIVSFETLTVCQLYIWVFSSGAALFVASVTHTHVTRFAKYALHAQNIN